MNIYKTKKTYSEIIRYLYDIINNTTTLNTKYLIKVDTHKIKDIKNIINLTKSF